MPPITGVLLAALVLSFTVAVGQEFGHFIGNPQTEWDPDGRHMSLLKNFIYVDPAAQEWVARQGSKIDGASIPHVFWSLIGGPFEGKYRNASVVHDTECQEPHKHDWRDVHRMFYFASRAGGVGAVKAKVMFAAGYHFGPRWQWNGQPPSEYSVTSENDALARRRGRRSTIVGLPPGAVPNFAKSLTVVARRRFSDAHDVQSFRGVRNPARSQNARFSLAHRLAATCRERDVRDESASVCLGGAGRQCIEAVLPLATDEVRVDVRAPSRSAVFRYGQHVSAMERVFTRHNPLVFQVRETV